MISRKIKSLSEKKLTSISGIFKRKRFWLALIYISLLIWSGIYRYNTPEAAFPEDKNFVQINAFDGNRKLDRKIRFAYKEFRPEFQNDNFPVILIHGSPGSAEVFDGLSKLIKDRQMFSVDLPGFGSSAQDIPDYSIYAHAKYLEEFLESESIKKAHFVGFSLGGGVILHLTKMAPEKVASVSFISSIGVQEYELLGDYHSNHFIHGAQLAFCWVVQELTPHFGIFDGIPMSYSRNFYDTDQRPLRDILEKIEKPFQIIHGKNDPLVPVEAAREHFRIVPQSEYIELDENHFYIFQKPEKVTKLLEIFWNNVENENVKTRSDAEAIRISEANKPFEYKILEAKGATVFVFFLILAINAFFNEDLAFLLAGICIVQGRFGFALAIIACLTGVFISILFWLSYGKYRGKRSAVFDRYRSSNIFKDRNFGFRFPVYFAFGKLQVGSWQYFLKFILSAIIWTFLLIFASYILANVLIWFQFVSSQNTFGLILVICLVYIAGSLIIRKLM